MDDISFKVSIPSETLHALSIFEMTDFYGKISVKIKENEDFF